MAATNGVVKYQCPIEKDIENSVFDNWEDIAYKDDIPIKQSNNEEISKPKQSVIQENSQQSSLYSSMASHPIILQAEDNYRTQYVPPKPQVKILKRNENSLQDSEDHSSVINGFLQKPKVSVKSLEQREAEYMEARLRIMGEAKYPEDKERFMDLQKKFELLKPTSNLLRQPRGPDGTSGFKQCR